MKKLFYGIALLMLCFCLSTCSNDTTPSTTLTVINEYKDIHIMNLKWGKDGKYLYNKKLTNLLEKRTFYFLAPKAAYTIPVKEGSDYLYSLGSGLKLRRTKEKITVKENEHKVIVINDDLGFPVECSSE